MITPAQSKQRTARRPADSQIEVVAADGQIVEWDELPPLYHTSLKQYQALCVRAQRETNRASSALATQKPWYRGAYDDRLAKKNVAATAQCTRTGLSNTASIKDRANVYQSRLQGRVTLKDQATVERSQLLAFSTNYITVATTSSVEQSYLNGALSLRGNCRLTGAYVRATGTLNDVVVESNLGECLIVGCVNLKDISMSGNACIVASPEDVLRLHGPIILAGDAWITSMSDVLCIGPSSSSGRWLTAHRDRVIGVRVNTGCFSGCVQQFRAAVDKTHAQDERFRNQYVAWANMIDLWAKQWPSA
jgi:hypothetical protein